MFCTSRHPLEKCKYAEPTITVVEGQLAKEGLLIDKEYGVTDLSGSKWRDVVAEREGADFTFVVDYGRKMTFDTVKLGAFEHFSSGIMAPSKIDVSVSNDNETYTPLVTVNSDGENKQANYERISAVVDTTTARYVKVKVYNPGVLPAGHNNAGAASWVMLDEFEVIYTGVAQNTALKEALESVSSIDVNAYTEETAIPFRDAKEAVQALFNEGSIDADAVEAAIAALNDAKDALVSRGIEVIYVSDPNNFGISNSILVDYSKASSGNWDTAGVNNYLWYHNAGGEKTVVFVVDLKEETNISNIGFSNTARPVSGVYSPSAKIYVSNDNVDFELVGSIDAPAQNAADREFVYRNNFIDVDAKARYVKYELTLSGGQEWLLVDELTINSVDSLKASLESLVDEAKAQSATGYGKEVKSFKDALAEAEAILDKNDVLASEYQKVYATLSEELDKSNNAPIITYSNPLESKGNNGNYGIVDGVLGSLEVDKHNSAYRNGTWSGNQNDNIAITLNYQKTIKFNQLSLDVLSNKAYGIEYPASVTFSVSTDGQTYELYETVDLSSISTDKLYDKYLVESHIKEAEAQYVKIDITRAGEWIFFGEFKFDTVTISRDEITSLINEVEALEDETSYTTDSVNALKAKLEKAKAVNNDSASNQNQLDQAAKELKEAKDALVSVKALKDAIKAAESIDGTIYSDESYARLEQALDNAQALLKDGTAEEIEKAIKNINDAKAALINIQGLPEIVEKLEGIKLENYTEDSAKALNDAVENAKAILADENSTQAMFDAALKDIEDAYGALVSVESLSKTLETAKDVDTSKYTKASLDVLEKAIKAAEEAMKNGTAEEVEKAEKALDEAYKALEVIEHNIVKVDEVPATYEKEGVKAHWVCEGCGKLYADAEGTTEVTKEDLVIAKLVKEEQPSDKPAGDSADKSPTTGENVASVVAVAALMGAAYVIIRKAKKA